jgi:hypothetical protein
VSTKARASSTDSARATLAMKRLFSIRSSTRTLAAGTG